MSAPTNEEVLKRYKRFMADSKIEHSRVLKECADAYAAYGGNSIGGQDALDLGKVWGKNPPEVGILLANVDTFWGSLIASRREPTFPGFDQGPEDEVTGEMLTMLTKAGRRWAGSDAVDEGALMDLIICGVGFAELALETQERPPFRPKERHITIDRIRWDTGHREKNMKDAQEFAVRYTYGIDEAKARFPGHEAAIQALSRDGASSGKAGAPQEGARALGGPAVTVSISGSDEDGAVQVGDGKQRRLREVPVDAYQFIHFEKLVSWEQPGPDGEPVRQESSPEDFQALMKVRGSNAAKAGEPFQQPDVLPYAQGTWYLAKIMAQSVAGEPRVLVDPEPIPGNQRLVRAMTGKGEFILDGETLKRRWFGWGRVLLGLQRLVSVAIRIEIEQEARRNRGSADVEADAFDSEAEFQAYVQARAIPGSVRKIKPGAFEKIHEQVDHVGSRVSSMKEMFQFFAIDLPAYLLGISEINKGTFQGDRSARFVSTMLEASSQMQTHFTSSFTDYLSEGATTMARLMLGPDGLDAADIDRLLGATGAKLREGITGAKNPESGEMEPIMVPDPEGEPQPDEATGEMVPASKPQTVGAWLKSNVGELFDNDVGFGLRPSAASERAANAALMSQHGVLKDLLQAAPPEAQRYVVSAFLKGSFAQGTAYADLDTDLQKVYDKLEAQQEETAKVQVEEGWLAYISGLATEDFEKASQLMQQASEQVLGPQQQQGGAPA
jgi:hypothetical protein